MCPNGQPGPVCTIENAGTIGSVIGTTGNVTVVINSGTISGTSGILMGGSSGLLVDNQADGTITGTGGVAIAGVPRLIFRVVNSGTINGNVVYNDAPAPNVFTGPLAYFVSDGGTLNGNLQLGTSGYTTATFLQRGSDDGVTGTISAGAGLDIFSKIYESSQSLELGQYALPETFEIEGYYAEGADTALTLTGSGTSISLGGEGSVVNTGTIGIVDAAAYYPAGAQVVPGAIGYFQPNNGVFRREQIPAGQPGSFFTLGWGNALTSFTNAAHGVVNGDITLATASFANAGEINLLSRSLGSTIYSAADTAFTFNNSGTIEMAVNGGRLQSPLGEFENGLAAALRLRSALNTTAAADVTIGNSGAIVGGLDVKMAAEDFVFTNTGSIEGIDNPGGYYTPGLVLGVGELSLVVGADPESHFDAATATIVNGSSGSIDHGFEAFLSAFEVSFTNNGFIAGADLSPDALFVQQYLDADDTDATSFTFVNTGTFEGNVGLETETSEVSITNSGTITGADYAAINQMTFQDVMFGGEAALAIDNETNGDGALTFTNSGEIINTVHAGSGVTIEVDAGEEGDDGEAPVIGSAHVAVVNTGTISATGGATVVTQQFANWLQPGQVLVNPLAALAVDGADVNGTSAITIDNQAGGLIEAGGAPAVVTPAGYTVVPNGVAGAFTVAVIAAGQTINITNAGTIRGGAGTTPGPNIVFDEIDPPDGYLAGAIQTAGYETGPDGAEVYVASTDLVTNTATGIIIGSIDLGGGDDTLDNAGSITGNVFLRAGNDRVLNRGKFEGTLNLGSGDDVLELGASSSISETVDLGDGADTVLLSGTAGAIGNLVSTVNAETLDVVSGAWIAAGVQSEYAFIEIEKGATLTVVENAEGSLAVEAPSIELGGVLNLDLSVDETEGDLGETTIVGTGSLHLVGTATVELTDATGLQHTGGTFVENGGLLLTTQYGGDIATSGEGVFTLAEGGDFTGNLVNDGTFVFAQEADYSFLGDFSGTGLLEKQGAGRLTFAGLYAFEGTTSVLGGSVAFTGQLSEDTELDLSGDGVVDLSQVEGGTQTIAQLSGSGGALELGETQLVIDQSANTVFAGEISGTGTLLKTGDGDLKLNGDGSSFTGTGEVDEGTLSVNGMFANATFEVNEGGKLGGNGTVGDTFVQGGTLGAGNSIGTLNVAGDLAFTSASVLEVEVDAAGNADLINVSGTATLGGAAVNVLAASGTYRPLTDYTILTASTISGTFGSVDTNLAFLDPTLVYSANAVTLRLARNDIDFAAFGTTPNESAIANLIESFGYGNALYNETLTLADSDVAVSFASLTGDVYPAYASATVETAEMLRRQTAGQMVAEGTYAWATGLYNQVHGGTSAGGISLDGKGVAGGLGFGAGGFSASAGLGLLDQDRGGSQFSDGEVTFAIGQVGYDSPAGFSARAGVQAGWVEGDTRRQTRLGAIDAAVTGTIEGDYLQLFGEVAYKARLGNLALEPFAGISHVSAEFDSVTETGAATALEVAGIERKVTFADVGLRLSTEVEGVRPFASAAYRTAWGDRASAASVGFAGVTGSATIGAIPVAKSAAELSAGLAVTRGPVEIEVNYDGMVSKAFDSHGITAGLKFRF